MQFTSRSRIAPLLLSSFLATPFVQHVSAEIAKYELQTPPLTTDWTAKVGTNPWVQYPRPQMVRSKWQSLNGIWTYKAAKSLDEGNTVPADADYEREVMVPSCLESGLSGLQGQNLTYSWLSTSFDVSPDWAGQRVLLNFGAVDYEATVYINGQKAGFNRGGFFSFNIDVTDLLKANGTNSLAVFVFDPTDAEGFVIPVGKQTLAPNHIFYRPCSGIWQTVWLEPAPTNHITSLDLDANMEGVLDINVKSSGDPAPVSVAVRERGSNATIATFKGTSNTAFNGTVESPKLWSPQSPNLYDLEITFGDEVITSYAGFRTFSRGKVNDIERPLINGKFQFLFGPLDQGYWPDGLFTPPNLEALMFDVQYTKDLGFNMIRKHIKVDFPQFYKACDEIGLVVLQDMPSMPLPKKPNTEQQAEFGRQLELMVREVKNFPSVIAFTIYNEQWGQLVDIEPFPEIAFTDRLREIAPNHLINSVSGWTDHGAGDFKDTHNYTSPKCGFASEGYDPNRIGFQGEFGGLGQNVSIEHLWNDATAIKAINETYEICPNITTWQSRGHELLTDLLAQIKNDSCSGAVYTQTTDVEGEINGFLTYDRRVDRTIGSSWNDDIKALMDAGAALAYGAL